jgi:hypothetical protein
MNVVKCAALLVAISVLGTASVFAEDPTIGRWVVDLSSCTGVDSTPAQSPLIITSNALRWSADSCRIGRSYRAGDTVHIEAFCSGEAGQRTIPVSLRSHGDRLQVSWNRGAVADMRRCP